MITRKQRFVNLAVDLLAISIGCGLLYFLMVMRPCIATRELTIHCGDCHTFALVVLGISALLVSALAVWREFFREERGDWC